MDRDIEAEVADIEPAEDTDRKSSIMLGPFEKRCLLCQGIVNILDDEYTSLSSRSVVCSECGEEMVK